MESAHNQTDPKSAWYEALKAENCVQVGRLLRHDSELLKVGWEDDLQKSEHPRGWNKRTALHVAARRGDVELVEQIRKILYSKSEGISMDSKKQGSRSSTDFKLLEVIDRDYDLNALAMAVVNGNLAIVNLLKRTSRHCLSNPYDIGPKDVEMEAPQLDTTAESNISNIISKAFSARDVDVQKDIQKMYDEDCDFNFLDKDVYLFHFTFSTMFMTDERRNLIRPIQKEIYFGAQKHGLLDILLSELKDGQGRTALHVAVDSQNVRAFLELMGDEHEDFLNVHDSAGRTPLYRAAAKNLRFAVIDFLIDKRVNVHAEIKYEANRWGVGLDIDKLSRSNKFGSDCAFVLSEKLLSKGFNNKYNAQAGPGPFIDPVTEAYSTALHVSILHKHEAIVKLLLLYMVLKPRHIKGKRFPSCRRRYTWPIEAAWRDDVTPYEITRRVSTMNLAVLVGDIPTLQHLLKAEEAVRREKPYYFSKCPEEKSEKKKIPSSPGEKKDHSCLSGKKKTILQFIFASMRNKSIPEEEEKVPRFLLQAMGNPNIPEEEKEIPSFLLAAAMGNPGCIKAFLDRDRFDPMIKDVYGNTALHHALKGRHIEFHPHLIDFVGCQHVFSSRWENDGWISPWLANAEEKDRAEDVEKDNDLGTKENVQDQRILKAIRLSDEKKDCNVELDNYGQRQGSINLLLQSGIDLWKKNRHARTCCPEHDAPKDFATWWYEKVADETQQVQSKLGAAANAIAVTAGLVATASYVGPLQPPLGYGGDPSSVQVGISSVRAFVICDSLSFYFALSALVLSLIPALPLETESMFDELVRTRIVVAFAVTFLFPSVICVLLAFAAGYAAVIPEHGLAFHGLTVATTVVGGFFCLIVMSWLSNRLYKVYKPLYSRFLNVTLLKTKKHFKMSLPLELQDILDGRSPTGRQTLPSSEPASINTVDN